MNVFFLGLGGNTGNRSGLLKSAREMIAGTCGSILSASSVYETESWGRHSDKKFLNQVISLSTRLDAAELLKQTLKIESSLGRHRRGERFDDRTMDIDLLFMEENIVKRPGLEIPHPLAHLRKFVLVPMNEIAPMYRHPVLGRTVQELLEICPDKLSVTRFEPSPEPTEPG